MTLHVVTPSPHTLAAGAPALGRIQHHTLWRRCTATSKRRSTATRPGGQARGAVWGRRRAGQAAGVRAGADRCGDPRARSRGGGSGWYCNTGLIVRGYDEDHLFGSAHHHAEDADLFS